MIREAFHVLYPLIQDRADVVIRPATDGFKPEPETSEFLSKLIVVRRFMPTALFLHSADFRSGLHVTEGIIAPMVQRRVDRRFQRVSTYGSCHCRFRKAPRA